MSWFGRSPAEQVPATPPATEQRSDAPAPATPLDELARRIQAANLPEAAATGARRELERLRRTDPSVAEYGVGLNYLEFVLDLPWNAASADRLDLQEARAVLDREHHGLAPVKGRILEHLAAGIMRRSRPLSVLVVDDEAIALENMAHALGKDGHKVSMAHSGAEALPLLEAEAGFDLVISDLKMGQVGGMELLRRIKASRPHTDVILVTGYATVDTAVEALLAGAVQFLAKPLDLEVLRAEAAKAAARRGQTLGQGPVLCFAGPPGTGKTSIGRAIAQALGRGFVRFSVAGLRDEAELRGHRRTYVGAMPGRILAELRKAGTRNPVFMLDEIDKIGQDFRGDPASVLLETLDPQQNHAFLDHFLDMPFDLSQVMFIATANMVETLPRPLLDRMEIIPYPSYTRAEKQRIAGRFLAPRQLADAGLSTAEVRFEPEALGKLVDEYTAEAGLRNLERVVGGVCRKVALQALTGEAPLPRTIGAADVPLLLGPPMNPREALRGTDQVGVVAGLVVGEAGGRVIYVETARMPAGRGTGRLITTGSMGRVLRESVMTALSHLRSRALEYALDPAALDVDVHVHIPAAAVPKDGPSAGLTIAVALLSLFSGRPASRRVAMTGELSLTGRVMPVGGVRDKVLAAQQAGIHLVLLPAGCAVEAASVAAEVGNEVELVLVETLEQAVARVLG